MKKIMGLIGAVVLGLTLSACSGGKPENVATDFIEASYKGNADKMISMIYLSAEEKEKAGVTEMLSGKVKSAAQKTKETAEQRGGVKSVSVKESNIDEPNGEGVVIVETVFKNDGSRSETDRIRLIKSDSKWKVRL